MPILPVSDFWERSFSKYYKLRWAQQEIWLRDDQRSRVPSIAYQHPWLPSFVPKYNIYIVISLAVILMMLVLAIPLSTNTSFTATPRDANPALYVTYQCIYTYFAYPCTVLYWQIAFPTTLRGKWTRSIFLPLPIFIITTLLYVLYVNETQEYYRTIGPTLSTWYCSLVYIIAVYVNKFYEYCTGSTSHGVSEQKQQKLLSDSDDDDDPTAEIQFSESITFSHTSQKATAGTHEFTVNSTILFEDSQLSEEESYFGANVTNYVHKIGWQCVVLLVVSESTSGAYYFCQYITVKWKDYSNDHIDLDLHTFFNNLKYILFLFPTYWAVINSIRFVATRFARLADRNKTSVYSLEIVTAFFFSCFYYVFYRNLFLHITSYRSFLFVKFLHIGLELMTYSVRMSKWYYDKTDELQQKVKNGGTLCCIFWPLYDPSKYYIWCVRLSLDYTLTFITSVGSAIAYIVGVLWLRYGYNQYFYDIIEISDAQFQKALVFTAIGFFAEAVVYLIIDKLMTWKYQIDVTKHWRVFIQHRPGYLYYFVFMLQHVSHDVMIAKLTLE